MPRFNAFFKHVSNLYGKGRMFVDIHRLGEPAKINNNQT